MKIVKKVVEKFTNQNAFSVLLELFFKLVSVNVDVSKIKFFYSIEFVSVSQAIKELDPYVLNNVKIIKLDKVINANVSQVIQISKVLVDHVQQTQSLTLINHLVYVNRLINIIVHLKIFVYPVQLDLTLME